MLLNNDSFWYIVSTCLVVTLCILFYLVFINIVSRRTLKSSVMSFVYKRIGPCLLYLCLLHVTSWITIVTLLLSHLGALYTRQWCEAADGVIVVGLLLCRLLMGLVWESQHRAMSAVLKRNSVVGRCILVLTMVLVVAPLIIIPVAVYSMKTEWNGDGVNCIGRMPVNVGRIELVTILSVSLTFFLLFVLQMWQAYHMKDDIVNTFNGSLVTTSSNVRRLGRNATLRNVFVTLCALVWLVVYDGPLNHHEGSTSDAYLSNVYTSRLVVALDVLTNNIVLYFVFRRWSFFLCYPCRKNIFISRHGESSTDLPRISLLFDDISVAKSNSRTSAVQLHESGNVLVDYRNSVIASMM